MTSSAKKNVLDVMTESYEAVCREQDAGKRYLALEKLDHDISAVSATKKTPTSQEKMSTMNMVGGLSAGVSAVAVMAFSPTSLPVDILLTIPAAMAGFLLGGAFGGVGCLAVQDRRREKKNMSYVKDVIPHLPALEDLSATVRRDIKTIFKQANLPELQQSAVLDQVIKRKPDLVARFEEAARRAHAQKKSAPGTGHLKL